MKQKLKFKCRIKIAKGCELVTDAVVTAPIGASKKDIVQELKRDMAEYCSRDKFQFTADDVKVEQIL